MSVLYISLISVTDRVPPIPDTDTQYQRKILVSGIGIGMTKVQISVLMRNKIQISARLLVSVKLKKSSYLF